MATCIGFCLFALFSGGAFFVILFFGELSLTGGRVVGKSFRVVLLLSSLLLGGAAWPSPSSGGVVFSLSLWVVLPFFPSFAWNCFSLFFCWVVLLGLLLLWVVVLSSLRPLGCFFFNIFWELAPPKGGGGRQHDLKKEEAKQPHPQGRKGKAAPLKGRRRDHHSTELNLTSVNLTNLNSFFWCF